jgi:hypothetical protein
MHHTTYRRLRAKGLTAEGVALNFLIKRYRLVR